MNNDLISREALKDAIMQEVYKDRVGVFVARRIFKLIDNAPTVESDYEWGYSEGVHNTERPHGEWLFNTTFWNCSVCKKPAKTIGYCGDEKFMNEFFKFCPNCGADMRGGAK